MLPRAQKVLHVVVVITERLYYSDCYLSSFKAEVVRTSSDGRTVYLNRTAFYPTSGGQPSDLGTLGGQRVLEVTDEDGAIAHTLSAPLARASVQGEIDWARRLDHMQQHTGQHLLSAVFVELLNIPTLSFHMGADVSTVELGTKELSDAQVEQVEHRANELTREARPVHISFGDASEVQELRKASSRSGCLRVVEIEKLDRSACGGTHVRSTAEVGPVQIRRSEKVRGNIRIEFVCGIRAVRIARGDFNVISELSRLMAIPREQLAPAVQSLRERLRETDKENAALKGEVARRDGIDLYRSTPESPDGIRRAQIGVEDIDEAIRAKALAFASAGHAMALAVAAESGAVLLAVSPDCGIDAGRVLKEFLARHAGRGGGSAALAQGNLADLSFADHFAAELGFTNG